MYTKEKQNKQLEQEENHSNEDHMDGDELGGVRGEWGGRYREQEA